MKIVTFETTDGKERYLLVDAGGVPIEEVRFYYHSEGIETNHIFIKLSGKNAGKAMNYTDVDNLFRSLRKKTGIYITPHMFRRTSLSILNSAGWSPELLRARAGHKNIYTTLNTYVHPSDDEVSEAFKKVSDKLAMPGKDGEE